MSETELKENLASVQIRKKDEGKHGDKISCGVLPVINELKLKGYGLAFELQQTTCEGSLVQETSLPGVAMLCTAVTASFSRLLHMQPQV